MWLPWGALNWFWEVEVPLWTDLNGLLLGVADLKGNNYDNFYFLYTEQYVGAYGFTKYYNMYNYAGVTAWALNWLYFISGIGLWYPFLMLF